MCAQYAGFCKILWSTYSPHTPRLLVRQHFTEMSNGWSTFHPCYVQNLYTQLGPGHIVGPIGNWTTGPALGTYCCKAPMALPG